MLRKEMERKSKERVMIKIVIIEIGGKIVSILIGNNRGERNRDIGEERRLRKVKKEIEGIIIKIEKIIDESENINDVKILIGDERGVMVKRIIIVENEIKREDKVIRVEIEGRSEMVDRMEIEEIEKMEGILKKIVDEIKDLWKKRKKFSS